MRWNDRKTSVLSPFCMGVLANIYCLRITTHYLQCEDQNVPNAQTKNHQYRKQHKIVRIKPNDKQASHVCLTQNYYIVHGRKINSSDNRANKKYYIFNTTMSLLFLIIGYYI